MARFPAISPEHLTSEQARTHEVMDLLRKTMGGSFVAKDSNGALIGPFAPYLYASCTLLFNNCASADIVRPLMASAQYTATDENMNVRERELCILAVCWATGAKYMVHAHSSICEKIGFSKEQVADALQGRIPKELDSSEEMVYGFAKELLALKEPLPKTSWEKAVAVLGREKVLLITLVVGVWSTSALVMNVADAPLPEENK